MLAFILVAFDETPTKTVQAFIDAFNARDAMAMSRRVVGQKPGKFPFPVNEAFPRLTATLGAETIDGDTATVPVDLKISADGHEQNTHEDVELKKVGDDWEIVPASKSSMDRGPEHIVKILALMVTDDSIFSLAKSAAKKTTCLSNVKQISLATVMYMADNDDRFPKDASRFKATVMPYLKNSVIFHCPEDAPGAVSYFFDPRLAGKRLADVAAPAQTAMVIEGAKNHAIFRHAGSAGVGYVDGHAKMVKADQMLKARTVKLK